MTDDKVVFLKFRNDKAPTDAAICVTGCATCHNKTFLIIEDLPAGQFPMVRCSACGTEIGRMGWVPDKEG